MQGKRARAAIPFNLRGRELIGYGKHRVVVRVSDKLALKADSTSNRIRKGGNKFEWDNYQRYFKDIPMEMRPFFVVLSRRRVSKGKQFHHTRLVRNHDGSLAKTVQQSQKISNVHFWKMFDRVVSWLLQNNIPYFELRPKNVMVKWISPATAIPVIIDYEKVGARTYPSRPWLRIPFFARLKLRRMARKIIAAHQG